MPKLHRYLLNPITHWFPSSSANPNYTITVFITIFKLSYYCLNHLPEMIIISLVSHNVLLSLPEDQIVVFNEPTSCVLCTLKLKMAHTIFIVGWKENCSCTDCEVLISVSMCLFCHCTFLPKEKWLFTLCQQVQEFKWQVSRMIEGVLCTHGNIGHMCFVF